MSTFQYGGIIENVTSTATAASTTTLTNTSFQIQIFTGTTTQTIVLPSATTYTTTGAKFEIINDSTGVLTVNHNGGTTLTTVQPNSTLTVKLSNNSTAAGVWEYAFQFQNVTSSVNPTVQKFTSGSGTYTTPTGVQYIVVEIVGGGGGGGGGGGSSGSPTAGGNTTFGSSLLTANGGAAGANGGGPSAGGTATVNSPAITVVAVQGGPGGAGCEQSFTGGYGSGGQGGSSAWGGGGGSGGEGVSGSAGVANTGGGGGGGGGRVSTNDTVGSGGAAGGYIKAIITSPASSYSYSVGSGGSGTGGTNQGAAGGTGYIVVTEYYTATGSGALSNPMTTGGDIIYGGSGGSPTRLANGSSGQVLTSNGGTAAPSWQGFVGARYYGSSTSFTSGSGAAIIVYSTQVYDTNSAYSNSTGLYTVPVAGRYRVTASVEAQNAISASATGENFLMALYHNGSAYSRNYFVSTTTASSIYNIQTSDTINCAVNDTIGAYLSQSLGSTYSVTGGSTTGTYITIELIK